jgi:signal transduction histidine kinase
MQNIFIILLVISTLTSLVVGFVVYFRDKNIILNRLLAAILIIASIWPASILLTLFTNNLLISNLSFFSTALIMPILALVFLSFRQISKLKTYLYLIPGFIFALLSLLDGLVSRGLSTENGYVTMTEAGPLFPFFGLMVLIYSIIAIYEAYQSYKVTEGEKKLQIIYLLIGIITSVFMGAIFNLVLPAFQIFELNVLGPIFILFTVATTVFAATRHYLYDRQVVFSELWAVLLILIGLVWLITNITFFNYILFVLLLSICLLFIRVVLSEANKKIALVRQRDRLIQDKEELQKIDILKDDFLKMAQHELNSPIALIEGKFSMIIDEKMGDFSDKQREYLKPLYLDAKRLAKLSKALVEVSEIDQGKIELYKKPININFLVNKVVKDIQEKAKQKNIALKIEISDEIPEINIDQDKIERVLKRLLDNAVKYTDSGEVSLKAVKQENYITIKIADTGVGIKKEDQDRIFEKFYQPQRFANVPLEQQGTGLNLYISKKLIELHGGQIKVESEENKGTAFEINLPLI